MQRQQKLLLSCMVGGLMLFYGIAALTSPEIAKTALGSTVHLGIFDAQPSCQTRSPNYHVIEANRRLVGKRH